MVSLNKGILMLSHSKATIFVLYFSRPELNSFFVQKVFIFLSSPVFSQFNKINLCAVGEFVFL